MHVMAGADEGGAENIMLESVLALAEAGLTQHVVTRPGNTFRIGKFNDAGIGVTTATFNTSWPFPSRRIIDAAITEFKPDVIEYWMGRAGQFAPAAYRSRSIAWYGGYYKLSRFRNCEWHVGLTIDLPAERDQLETRSDPRFVELRHHVYEQIQKAKTYTGDTDTIRTVA